uniref:Reverse transcriptase domain-containing protein n=1 Tax=Rhodnius prolixus TaxID=13249 RepID=T1HA01_RHOPR
MAYDRVNRNGLFKCMRVLGFPELLIRLVAMYLRGNCGKVMVQGKTSREFEINKGLRLSTKANDIIL